MVLFYLDFGECDMLSLYILALMNWALHVFRESLSLVISVHYVLKIFLVKDRISKEKKRGDQI